MPPLANKVFEGHQTATPSGAAGDLPLDPLVIGLLAQPGPAPGLPSSLSQPPWGQLGKAWLFIFCALLLFWDLLTHEGRTGDRRSETCGF